MSFNQSGPTVPTVLNTSNCFVFGNTASGNALSVQQLGAGNVFAFSNSSGRSNVMVMNNLGQVGIGTTNPGWPLDVLSSGSRVANFVSSANGSGNIRFQCTDGTTPGTGFIGINAFNNSVFGLGSSTGIPTVFYQNGTEYMRIHTNGNVGIGTANPGGTFNVLSGNAGFPDTSGSGTSNVAARIQSGSICLDFGSIGGTNPFWIQNHLNTAWNTTYPILLNPNGGYVGVGTTNPGYALDVLGSARVNVGTSNVLIGAGQGAGQGGLFMIPQSSIAGSSWNLGCGLQGSYSNAITFTSGTNVGIGTTNPGYALDVNGTVNLTGVRIGGSVGGNSTGQGTYLRGSGTAGLVGWGVIQEFYYTAGTIPTSTWTNIVAQSTLGTAGIKNAFVHVRMFGAWWGTIQTIVDSSYSGYPSFVSNSPCYQSGFEVRFSGGWLQILQNSGGNAGMDIIVTKIGW